MKQIWTLLESFKRKLKLLESPKQKPAGNWREKKSKEFKGNKRRLIELEKKKIWNS